MSCVQNPKERITLPNIMRHPWVTKRGAWPLQTVREMGGVLEDEEDEINPQLVSLPDMMNTVNVLDVPRQVHASHPTCKYLYHATLQCKFQCIWKCFTSVRF
jgi:hypothetical protein